MSTAPGEIRIRAAIPDDAEAIARLSGELGYPTTASDARRRLFDIKTAEHHAVMVAEDEAGSVVGWIHVFRSPRLGGEPFAELGGLVVTEGLRGHGIGSRLVAEAESWALGQGIATLRIRTRTTRNDARLFYEDLGFVLTKTQVVFERQLLED
ncbi:MAG: GNAT family N-acetyltransferase [Candidatus Palauibacterales bacterium]|nr:GNAT family N-acetyltransferase [Candidatus Palauibacterales bacterium]MDP2483118.1 GNAT family N-acetyltransferase [Candidatus Palauibacterales bacterium]